MDLSKIVIKPADFNIGGERVSGASLDFSGISAESLMYSGSCHILIMLQNYEKTAAIKRSGDKSKGAAYQAEMKSRAKALSGASIDMEPFAPTPDWDWTKGPSTRLPAIEKAQAAMKQVTDKAELLALQKELQAQLKNLG